MESIWRDLRFAARALRKSPGFTLVAVFTLAIGIGASSAIFSVVDAVLLESPSYRDPDRLVVLWHRMLGLGSERTQISGPDVVEFEEAAESFQGFAFTNGAVDIVLEDQGAGEHARVGLVTPNFFSILGVDPIAGRTFLPDEALIPPDAIQDSAFTPPPSTLVLSHGLWQQRFGGDPNAVGRSVRLSGVPMTIVGVLPADFELLLPPGVGLDRDADAWTPLRIPLASFRRAEGLRDQDSDNTGAVIGRLVPGVTLEQATAEMETIAARQRNDVSYYRNADMRIQLAPIQDDAVRHARPALLALLGAVGFVLLIACLNIANLLLARGAKRHMEMALRSTLGASRSRLLRQVLTEGALLAALGATFGILVAVWGVDLLLALGPEDLPSVGEVGVDATLLGFTLVCSATAAVLFGAVPGWALAWRTNAESLKEAGPRGGGGRRARLRKGLVVTEIALSLALLAGAGLMLRSFAHLQRVDPGFEPAGLLTFQVTLPGASIGGPGARATFMSRLEERVRRLPGVQSVGLVGGLPLSDMVFTQPYGLEGSSEADWSRNEANFRVVSAEYFETMGTRLLSGRSFTPAENVIEDERVVIVDVELARRVSADGNAVGRQIGVPLDGDPVWATIVGVVENVRYQDLRRPGRETIYAPYRQEASRTVTMAVRSDRESGGLVRAIRGGVGELETDTPIPLYGFRSMEEYVGRALAPTRFALTLLSLFAGLALVLAAVGLFGVISYAVSHQTREFGVRMALGASAAQVLRQVLLGGLGLASFGVALGIVLAMATSRVLSTLLFGVTQTDALTYAVVALVLISIAAVACWIPARRAATVEPAVALRHE
jgi:putative ABC transport system permease protein